MAANPLSFAFRPELGETPETLKRRRAVAEAMLAGSGRTPQNVGEGLTAIGSAIGGRLAMGRVNRAETAGREGAAGVFGAMFGGGGEAAPGGGDMPIGVGGGGSQSYRDAIAGIESAGSGDYSAVGPRNATLGRPLGRYQVMEANVGPWSEEILGRRVSADEFLANPQLQDAIFDAKFGSYVQKYGPEGAAQAWFAGPGGVGKVDRKDVLGTDVGSYGQRFMKAAGGGGGAAPVQVASLDPSAGISAVAGALGGDGAGMPPAGPQPAAGGVQVAQAGGGLSEQQQLILQALSNPWLNDSQRSVAELLWKQEMERADPASRMELEKMSLEIDQLRNPPQDPYTLGPGDVRHGPDNKAVATVPDTTTGIKDYDAYAADVKAAGGTPLGRLEFEQAVRRAGATSITTMDTAADAEAKARGAAAVKSFQNFADDLPAAEEMALSVDRLDSLAQSIDPGTEAGFVNWVRETTGVELAEGTGALQAFKAATNYLAPRMRPPGSGATSNFDANMFINALPSLLGTPEGNQLAVDTLKGMTQKRVQLGYIAQDYLIGEIDAKTATEQMRALPDPFAAFKEAQKQKPVSPAGGGAGGAAPAIPTDLQKGQSVTVPDGQGGMITIEKLD